VKCQEKNVRFPKISNLFIIAVFLFTQKILKEKIETRSTSKMILVKNKVLTFRFGTRCIPARKLHYRNSMNATSVENHRARRKIRDARCASKEKEGRKEEGKCFGFFNPKSELPRPRDRKLNRGNFLIEIEKVHVELN